MKAARAIAAALVLSTSGVAFAQQKTPDPDPWFGRDKAYHFAACTVISAASYAIVSPLTNDIRVRIVFGSGAGIAAGAGKELIDLAGYGDPSWRDFTWDVVGTVVGTSIAIAIDIAIRGWKPVVASSR